MKNTEGDMDFKATVSLGLGVAIQGQQSNKKKKSHYFASVSSIKLLRVGSKMCKKTTEETVQIFRSRHCCLVLREKGII